MWSAEGHDVWGGTEGRRAQTPWTCHGGFTAPVFGVKPVTQHVCSLSLALQGLLSAPFPAAHFWPFPQLLTVHPEDGEGAYS